MSDRILLIEDNDDDVLMIRRAFEKGKIGNGIYRACNGREGLEYFENEESTDIELILLDLNMEVMNGFEFLKQRQENPRARNVPVVVLTSSFRQEDINRAYELGANSYVEKPLNPRTFIEVLMKIEDFWLFIAKKPRVPA